MKQKLFILFALLITTMTASATDVPTYSLTKANGAEAHGTITFTVGEKPVTEAAEGDVVTMTIAPTTGYVLNEVSGQWYASITRGIDLLDKVTLTPVQGQENQWQFTMARANVEISASYKKLLTNSAITVQDITALTYTGVAQTPTVTVNDGETQLVENTDYTVSYSNNTNAALSTATENAPTVTITAVATSDKYAGTTTKTFTINKKALTVTADNKSVTFGDDAPTYTESYDGFVNNETKAVLGGTLALACDYVKDQSGAGDYEITPSGLTSSNYDITFTKGTLTVGKKALESSMIAAIEALTYNGNAQTPEPVVTFNEMTLEAGTDYTIAYANNTAAALATATENAPTVTITATENCNYSGEASVNFTIQKKALTITAEDKTATFGDAAPAYTVTYDGFENNETATVLGGTLALDCDYVQNESGAGEYEITPSGLTSDNYEITFTAGKLTVGKKALESSMIAAIEALTYDGTAQTPEPVVTFNEMTLEAGTDYTVAYANNTAAALATATENAPTVTITAVATSQKYAGTTSKTFTIQKKALTITAVDETVTFGDAAPVYTVMYAGFEAEEGATVLGGTLALACDYVQNESGVGEYAITPSGLTSDDYEITFTAGKLTVEAKALENSMIATISDQVYSGDSLKPVPVVTFHEMTLKAGTDYIATYKNNIVAADSLAEAAPMVTITAIEGSNYKGEALAKFNILTAEMAGVTTPVGYKLVYTGEEQVLIKAGSVEGGKLVYSIDNETWSENLPKAKAIGSYTVYYKVVADENHSGEASGNVKASIAGYELSIGAGEFITYYRSDTTLTLSVASADAAKLYTVTSVSETQATIETVNVAAAGLPLLVQNTSDEALTVYLVPASGTADEITAASEFKGTDAAKDMPGSSDACDYYVLNGNAFTWVMDEGTIGANKCWLEISNQTAETSANARALVIGSGTTGIESIHNSQLTIDNYYDLNGRMLQGKPTKKGIYIHNGKKVVVK